MAALLMSRYGRCDYPSWPVQTSLLKSRDAVHEWAVLDESAAARVRRAAADAGLSSGA